MEKFVVRMDTVHWAVRIFSKKILEMFTKGSSTVLCSLRLFEISIKTDEKLPDKMHSAKRLPLFAHQRSHHKSIRERERRSDDLLNDSTLTPNIKNVK